MPRPRHPSGGPQITPLKQPRPIAQQEAKTNVPSPETHDGHASSATQGWDANPDAQDEDSLWEEEAAEELVSDMWLDELEHRMSTVYPSHG